MSQDGIAIVGMACRYPDASSPEELWDNSLAARQAFRAFPRERLGASYFSSVAEDCTYATHCAVIADYTFDRSKYGVSGVSFRSADLTHWLALDVCSDALANAQLDLVQLPKDRTGVFVGNTLAGEFSRAATLRLRWPYVETVVRDGLRRSGMEPSAVAALLGELQVAYKKPFPGPNEETLAGGMSNTIAGRICGYFDFKGGGYSIDAACASSLVATISGCKALATGELDVAIAGGVDLSLDPFELVGFARAGALATGRMRVFDSRACGFWPGEGAGFVVLMRLSDAIKNGQPVRAVLRGWGVSSDGAGGITRPEVGGQALAIKRAYEVAGYCPTEVPYYEAHGTGTAVGDIVELTALSQALADSSPRSHVVASVKANIGHTKAAAGVAGLIRAVRALETAIIPPVPGFESPNSVLSGDSCPLSALKEAIEWPAGKPIRAGVSAFGFGGVNAHVTIEAHRPTRGGSSASAVGYPRLTFDAELLLFSAASKDGLLRLLDQVKEYAERLSFAELGDLANALFANHCTRNPWRKALVASTPAELLSELSRIRPVIEAKQAPVMDQREVGLLFPGQGSPVYEETGAMGRWLGHLSSHLSREASERSEAGSSERAQRHITSATLLGLDALRELGIEASVAIGHSLGELVGLHWAGCIDRDTLSAVVGLRGAAMDSTLTRDAGMLALSTDAQSAKDLISDLGFIANLNSPSQTIVAGTRAHLRYVEQKAREAGIHASRLAVDYAFHSPLMCPAEHVFDQALDGLAWSSPNRHLISTVGGGPLALNTDIRRHLVRQVTSPVNFVGAMKHGLRHANLWVEVGPGRVLSSLASACGAKRVIAIDVGGPSMRGLLEVGAECFDDGLDLNFQKLFYGRYFRPFDLHWSPRFFVNPCESTTPVESDGVASPFVDGLRAIETDGLKPLDAIRALVSKRTDLPLSSLSEDMRFLSDLRLNSIIVGQIVSTVFQQFGLSAPLVPTDFANASLAEVAQALQEQLHLGPQASPARTPDGLEVWTRCFVKKWSPAAIPAYTRKQNIGEVPNFERFCDDGARGFCDSLCMELLDLSGRTVLLALSGRLDDTSLLLRSAKAAAKHPTETRFVVVQTRGGASAIAKTLFLEEPSLTCCVINVPSLAHEVLPFVVAEIRAAEGYSETRYTEELARTVPAFCHFTPQASEDSRIRLGDVLLVAGGAKGIGAEIALGLAKRHRLKVGLLGRSDPQQDETVRAALERFRAYGIEAMYAIADVGLSAQLSLAVKTITDHLGQINVILHGAGTNQPRLLSALDEDQFRATVATKVSGFRNLVEAAAGRELRLVACLGSLIADSGFRGEAHYGTANEWMRLEAEAWKERNPDKHLLVLDSSVWSGVGMGERLGAVDSLTREGILPLSPEAGVPLVCELLCSSTSPDVIAVASRFGNLPTLQVEKAVQKFSRFIGHVRVSVRGVELIVDFDISADSDPYLLDHEFEGQRLFPAVMGLEAMAQVASNLLETDARLSARDVEFVRAVAIPEGGIETLRLAAIRHLDGSCSVALRTASTSFQRDHFRAHFELSRVEQTTIDCAQDDAPPLFSGRDLYRHLCFQGGRFQRVDNFHQLSSRGCNAKITAASPDPWYWPYASQLMSLGDPGARDAALHAIQACVPHLTVLPTGVDRIELGVLPSDQSLFVHATEVSRDGKLFRYDVAITDEAGGVLERWIGLHLVAVTPRSPSAWPTVLTEVYIHRVLDSVASEASFLVKFTETPALRRGWAAARARREFLIYRPDGKPEPYDRASFFSAAHSGDLSCEVQCTTPVGCDLEQEERRDSETWMSLLGKPLYEIGIGVSREHNLPSDQVLTGLWASQEALFKLSGLTHHPLISDACGENGTLIYRSGRYQVCIVPVVLKTGPHVFAISMERPTARKEKAHGIL